MNQHYCDAGGHWWSDHLDLPNRACPEHDGLPLHPQDQTISKVRLSANAALAAIYRMVHGSEVTTPAPR